MTQRTEQMTPHEVLEQLLASDSRDEIHVTIQAWLRANPNPVVPPLYAVFGYPLMHPGDRELLGVYTSRERAAAFVGAQDEAVQQNLRVEDLELDRYPSDDFWKRPAGESVLPTIVHLRENGRIRELEVRLEDAEAVIHRIANDSLEMSSQKHAWQVTDHIRWCTEYGERARRGLPEGTDSLGDLRDEIEHQRHHVARLERENAILRGTLVSDNEEGEGTLGRRLVEILQGGELSPDDAIAAIEAMRNDERDVAALRIRIAELERGRVAHIEWLRERVATLPAAEAVGAIRRYLGDTPSRSLAHLRDELRAVVRGEREMPPARRAMLETPAARERFLSQLAHLREGDDLDLHVCDRPTGEDQERLRERIRVLQDLEDELRRVWEMPRRDEVSDRIERYRPRLERLAADEECARVCGYCGRAISRIAGYVEQSVLSHTHAPGTCDVCGLVGSVSPSEDWIGQGD